MSLDLFEVEYFVTQLGLSASVHGADPIDVQSAKAAVMNLFAYRCSPPQRIIKDAPVEPQAICDAVTCPHAVNGICDSNHGYTFNNGTSPEPSPALIMNNPRTSSSSPSSPTPRSSGPSS